MSRDKLNALQKFQKNGQEKAVRLKSRVTIDLLALHPIHPRKHQFPVVRVALFQFTFQNIDLLQDIPHILLKLFILEKYEFLGGFSWCFSMPSIWFFYREDISFDLQQDLESLEICLCFWMNWIIKRVGIFLWILKIFC